MSPRERAGVVFALAVALAACRKSEPRAAKTSAEGGAAADPVAIADAGAREPSWACTTAPEAAVTLPRESSLGAVLFAEEPGEAPLLAYVADREGGRRHEAVRVRSSAAPIVGPAALGDAPPWTPFGGAGHEGFVRLAVGAKAAWSLHEGARVVAEGPLAVGDELAADAIALEGGRVVVALSVAEGVEVKVFEAGNVRRSFRIEGAESPVLLRAESGAFVVAARVEAVPEAAKTVREVPTSALEGAGQDRTSATLRFVDEGGKSVAAHTLAAGEEVLGAGAAREGLFLATRRVVKAQSTVDIVRVAADGRRAKVGEFPRRRGGRLVPLDRARGAAGAELLELSSEGVVLLGERGGALGLTEVDGVLAARAVEDRLEIVAVRETADAPRVFVASCRLENR